MTNKRGQAELFCGESNGSKLWKLESLKNGVIAKPKFSPDGKWLGLVYVSAIQPADIYAVSLQTRDLTQITSSWNGKMPSKLVKPKSMWFQTGTKGKVHSFYYEPDRCRTKRMPLLISLHGGPEYQDRPIYNFNYLYQYLASNGIAVLAINYSGSTGYGREFQSRIYRNWGDHDLRDVVSVIRAIRKLPDFDDTRLGLIGTSYGAYLTLLALFRSKVSVRVAVAISPITNIYQLAQRLWLMNSEFTRIWLGDPRKEKRRLEDRSPETHIRKIDAKLLLISGGQDPLVDPGDLKHFFNGARQNNVDIKLTIVPSEGHVVLSRENELRIARLASDFILEHLA